MARIVLACLAALFIAAVASPDEPRAQLAVATEASKSDDQRRRSEALVAKQYAQIRSEFEAQRSTHRQAATRAEGTPDKQDRPANTSPDLVAYCRRMVDLAESCPDGLAARDALIWVFNAPGSNGANVGAYRDQLARAGALLVRYHGDDPEAVRIGLTSGGLSFRRDALLFGFYVAAKGREAKGLARLALAQYLEGKAKAVVHARSLDGRPERRSFSGGKIIREIDLTDEEYADRLVLRHCDPQVIRAEAMRLYEEVTSEYGDIPYVTWRHRELAALLKQPTPEWNGKPLTDERRHSLEAALARKRALGQEAADRLDVMLNLAISKPAPEIKGTDMDGKPLKLSDYKGKVVVLVFWGTWCVPCMALVPHERELVARLKGQPFALLGVDCKDDKETARKVMARERMTWPSWYDGAADTGPIAKRYHVQGLPQIVVIDAKGVIRARGSVRNYSSIDQNVDRLLAEIKRPTPAQGAPPPASQER